MLCGPEIRCALSRDLLPSRNCATTVPSSGLASTLLIG